MTQRSRSRSSLPNKHERENAAAITAAFSVEYTGSSQRRVLLNQSKYRIVPPLRVMLYVALAPIFILVRFICYERVST